ncbi:MULTISPECIES: LysE family translocator [Cycloclasticus]|uniref:LysE family translocator protein n=1 Tax=Cycloclasticus pugetii TaxID=34068 RepID=A0AB33Z3D3_9GAMM|nr:MULTISPECIES: LysE family translocator [Cycloclasticus]ATI03373.1 LysE family translocator [Cycloclasticus sp. PY97N]EPD13845.1 LysE family translocator protein [Cycloclasticus pugetii]
MSIIEIITLFGMMVALAALPSASVALVVTRSATFGVANGVAVTAGIILGDLIFILLAIVGLSVVADTLGSLFMVIKYLGAAYLLRLGYTLITSNGASSILVDKSVKQQNLFASFAAGLILTLGDIKAIIFYASFLPVFVNLSTVQTPDILILISIMVISLASVKILYAFSAAKIVAVASANKFDNVVRKTAGSFMLAAGGYLIFKD